MKNLTEKIQKVVDENWSSLPPFAREPYEDNSDGFTHYSKSGLIEEIEEEIDNEKIEPTKENIEALFFDMV